VHAKDAAARQWYLHWEFEPSPSDPLHLFLLIKDIKAMVGPKPRLKAQGCGDSHGCTGAIGNGNGNGTD
jgi:hypothetical protein